MKKHIKAPDNLNRYGSFEVGIPLTERDLADSVRVLEGCLIVRAECLLHKRVITYIAIHPDFRPVQLGEVTPAYSAVLEDGKRVWRTGD